MLRPQPIGVFPGVAGLLVLPPVPRGEELVAGMLRGWLPQPWPAGWEFFARALAGEDGDALIRRLPEGPEGIFNRFVLRPEPEVYAWAGERLGPEWLPLLDAVAWRVGLCPAPPDPEGADGELAAFLLATQAYAALQRGDRAAGLERLRTAAGAAEEVSPVLAARLYAEWAALCHVEAGREDEAIEGYRRAIRLLEDSDFPEVRAELWFQLGSAYQGLAGGRKGPLLEAARCYQEALKVFRRDTHPEAYAMAQMNLALAYLAMPPEDRAARLRAAVAVQALREALRVFQRDTHPELWASATLNLANALQHVPSAHPANNLREAVALYDQVLAVRRPGEDPLGYARVLANQGNALAHLGHLAQAEPRLQEARRLFQEHGDTGAAAAVEAVLEDIGRLRRRQATPAPAEEGGGMTRGTP
ncbi:tetratricopeptide repeat protein [Thermaerobacter sp. PB12/4term]|uniref:tetratricopeptide repeat protein n=1 Tax=Thermaerobacter sp. PB12/4term TaxID=2293838 RepID=UPI00193FC331|nr:tetratricopeptide repeat protein [Thermaerobacter sp. PB12/4term]